MRDGLLGAQAAPEGRQRQVPAAGLPLVPRVQRGAHPRSRERALQHDRAPPGEGLRAQPGPDPGRGRGGARPPALRDVLRGGAVRREDTGRGHGEGGQHRDAGADRAVRGLVLHGHVPAQRYMYLSVTNNNMQESTCECQLEGFNSHVVVEHWFILGYSTNKMSGNHYNQTENK